MRGRTITLEVSEKRGKVAKTIPLYQYDYGQKVLITGITLPDYYEVHFSTEMHGSAVTVIGDSTGADIPDSLLEVGDPIYLWVFLHETGDDGETEYAGVIPIIKKAEPTDITPTPEEQSQITEIIAKLNTVVGEVEEKVADAEDAKDAAVAAQAAAEAAQESTEGIVDDVNAARDAATAAQSAAESAQSAAETAQSAAESAASTAGTAANTATGAKNDAAASATSASSSATSASSSAASAGNAKTAAENAQTAAETAQTAAETAQGKAEDAQSAAENAETAAEGSALIAEGYAVGKQNGEDVASGSGYYHNNAKYYAEQAAAAIADVIDDDAGAGDTDVTWSADKLTEETSALLTAIEGVEEKIEDALLIEEITEKSENLFDKTTAIDGYYFITNGDNIGKPSASDGSSIAYVLIDGTGDYTWKNNRGTTGDYYSKYAMLLDSDKNYIGRITGTVDSGDNGITHFTVAQSHLLDGAVYFAYQLRTTDKPTAMIVKKSTYPAEYIPYYNREREEVYFKGHITSENADFIERLPASENLFNKNGNVSNGKVIKLSDGTLIDEDGISTQFVPFDGEGTYYCLYPQNYYGQYNIKLCLYDEDYTFLRAVSGTRTVNENQPNPCYFSISASDATDVKYIGYSYKTSTENSAMFVKSDTYPSEYIPYYPARDKLSTDILLEHDNVPFTSKNPLYGKSVVFDGDSICESSTTGSWARWIGEKNAMDWHNVGVGGGTITAGTTASGQNRHWVSRYIDTIHSNYPTLDYLILEGGTNDADLLTDEEIGTLNPANYSTYDDETFVGALESLFNKATSYYPSAKIGFIIAHKMGDWTNAGYDAGDSPSNRRRRKFFEIAIDVCKKWGIPYIDLWQGSPLCPRLEVYYDPNMTPEQNRAAGKAYIDGQHLTQVGYDIISPKIEAWMKTL